MIQVLQSEPLEIDVPKGPTAEAILKLTASGRKPPIPETWQLDKQKNSVSKLSTKIETAAAHFSKLSDRQLNNETDENFATIPKKVPGYRQTWGIAFSQEPFAVSSGFGPGGARYPENYPPGLINQERKTEKRF